MLKEEIEIMNKTARSNGAVGQYAIVPEIAKEKALSLVNYYGSREKIRILDYGAGPKAIHARALRKLGFNVTAWEIGENFNKRYHDQDALCHSYEIIYASNVLNVQPNVECLIETLKQLRDIQYRNAWCIVNYPNTPRKLPEFKTTHIHALLLAIFSNVDRRPKNVFICK